MELTEAMRTTHACRRYLPDPVPDDVLRRAVEVARFAPQGGNRQGVRFVVVRDPELKRRLGAWYLVPWREAYDAVNTGRETLGFTDVRASHEATNRFAEHFGEHPAIVVVCVDPGTLAVTDAGLERVSIVGGASVYPMVQNLCLALRDQGVATRLTTLLVAYEEQVRDLLGIPDPYITACHIVAGYPQDGFPTRLRRLPVEDLVFADRFGEPLAREG